MGGQNPFSAFMGPSDPNGSGTSGGTGAQNSAQRDQEIRDLKEQLAAMRQQIAELAQRK
jgi:hypothetical protein